MKKSIVMLGASGAVGGEALKELLWYQNIDEITVLGRRLIFLNRVLTKV